MFRRVVPLTDNVTMFPDVFGAGRDGGTVHVKLDVSFETEDDAMKWLARAGVDATALKQTRPSGGRTGGKSRP